MKLDLHLRKICYEVDPPAAMTFEQVASEMQKIADEKGCTIEFCCRGILAKVKPSR